MRCSPTLIALACAAVNAQDSGGCPADTSGAHLSTGFNGNPDKSQIDSINYIRRLYSSTAACLDWSDSLGAASQTCADQGSEVNCARANSVVVSVPDSINSGYKGDLAVSQFEQALFVLLCQSPDDPQLQGTCGGPGGGGPTGQHDVLVDSSNEYRFIGCGINDSTGYLSCSFSATRDVFGV